MAEAAPQQQEDEMISEFVAFCEHNLSSALS